MFKKFSIPYIVVFLLACGVRKSVVENPEKTIQIMYLEDYCGGAAPPVDLIQELSTPKPYKSGILYWTTNDSSVQAFKTLKTNKNGQASIKKYNKAMLFFFKKPIQKLSVEEIETMEPTEIENYQCELEFSGIPNGVLDFSAQNLIPDTLFLNKSCNHCLLAE